MMALAPDRAAFGRHETFPLRFGWLTKGHRVWSEDHGLFEQEEATVKLGVGKNMVAAIRYWMLATQVAKVEASGFQPSGLGRRIFGEDGWDPYLEDDATLWLLHWLLASNAAEATALFWFFNRYHKPEFTGQELQQALKAFVAENLTVRVSEATLKNDVALLLRMYQPSVPSKSVALEESLDSPMSTLGLIRPVAGTKYHESFPDTRDSLPPAVFGYAVAEVFAEWGEPGVPVERLMRSDGRIAAPGSVFRLTEEGLIGKLEELIAWQPGLLEVRESAGIHQVFRLGALSPLEYLERHYGGTH
jgi:hypothetical protein